MSGYFEMVRNGTIRKETVQLCIHVNNAFYRHCYLSNRSLCISGELQSLSHVVYKFHHPVSTFFLIGMTFRANLRD